MLPDIIHHNQTGYVKDRFIGETIRSIYDIMDFTVNPIQTGGGLLRPYQTLKLNNFKAVKAMTTKFSDFS